MRATTLIFCILISVSCVWSQEGEIRVINGTFLGNEGRNYSGDRAPDRLDVIWKHYLGKGETVISRKIGSVEWKGAGWTGQPLMVQGVKI